MGLAGEVEGFGDDVDLLAVTGVQVGIEQMVERICNHLVVSLLPFLVFKLLFVHSIYSLVSLFHSQLVAHNDVATLDAVELAQFLHRGVVALGYLA